MRIVGKTLFLKNVFQDETMKKILELVPFFPFFFFAYVEFFVGFIWRDGLLNLPPCPGGGVEVPQ